MNNPQDPYSWFETAIQALEHKLGARITVIDNQGMFHTPAGRLIFPIPRQSHRKIPACDSGFSRRCIDCCRHEMNRESVKHNGAFTKTCWKGITEIVVPLRRSGQHWGMFYFGAWRGSRPQDPASLPAEFHTHFQALPRWKKQYFTEIAPILEAFAGGLIARIAELNAVTQLPLDRPARIAEYLQREAGSQDAGIARLARELHLSPSRTSRLVQQSFGCGFSTLLHQERIRRAKVLLISTQEKLAFIAASTGFCDEYHFSKIFRKETGQPPGQFRKEHQFKPL